MNRIILAITIFLCSFSEVYADSGITKVPCGYQQLTSISGAKKLTIPASCGGGPINLVVFTAEAQAVRYRDDGVAPTATVGMPVAVGVTVQYEGTPASLQFIEQTSGGIVDASYYR